MRQSDATRSGQLPLGVRISGTGSAAPLQSFTNEQLAENAPTSPEWVEKNLGIKKRHVVSGDEVLSDFTAQAGAEAIKAAGLKNNDIDLIIVATMTPERMAPSTACLTKHKLGISNHCPAFDMAAACSGFVYALTVGADLIKSGMSRRALIIGADVMSKMTDWSRRDCVFFGDGAGAVVLEGSDDELALFSGKIFSGTENTDHFTVYPDQAAFTMNTRAVFDTATEVLPLAIQAVLDRENITLDRVKWLIPHQPSVRILRRVAEKIGMPFEQVKTNMDRYANTSAGTIPILLNEVNRRNELTRGDIVVFAGVGSGWTWGAAVYRWH